MSEAEKVETRNEKFVRLAESRVTKALDAINALRPLANKAQYEAKPEQLEIIFNTLSETIEEVSKAFATGTVAKSGFSLAPAKPVEEPAKA